MTFNLKCQPCGKTVTIGANDPTCATEFMAAAHLAGWVCYHNNIAQGIVVFCSHECCSAALTKNGFFRRDLGRGRVHKEDKQ